MIDKLVTAFFVLILLLSIGLYAPPDVSPAYVTSPDTGSMEPTITPEDVVIIIGWKEPQVNDVVLFDAPTEDQAVLHRIVDQNSKGYITKGDANSVIDQESGFETVARDNIYGVVMGGENPITIPYIGLLISNPLSLLVLWIVFLILNLAPENDGHPRTEMVISNSPTILFFFICILLFFLPLFTALTAASADVTISTVNTPGSTPDNIVQVGNTGSQTIEFLYQSTPITEPFVITNSEDLIVNSISREDEYLRTQIQNAPRETIGVDKGVVSVYTYIGILPDSIVYSLIRIHYLLPSIIDGIILSGVMLTLWAVLLSRTKNIRRSRDKIYKMRRQVKKKFR